MLNSYKFLRLHFLEMSVLKNPIEKMAKKRGLKYALFIQVMLIKIALIIIETNVSLQIDNEQYPDHLEK